MSIRITKLQRWLDLIAFLVGRRLPVSVEDIMEAVNTHDAELIVIGVRTRSATGKFLRGSNALEILHDAKVPVLCVKRDALAAQSDDSAAAR